MSSSSVGVIARALFCWMVSRGQAMARLRRDDDAGSAASHHASELFQDDRGPLQIHMKDGLRRRLTRRHAGVDQADDVAHPGRHRDERMHGLA